MGRVYPYILFRWHPAKPAKLTIPKRLWPEMAGLIECKRGSELKGWILTIPAKCPQRPGGYEYTEIRDIFVALCARWVFQLERGMGLMHVPPGPRDDGKVEIILHDGTGPENTGYLHYQATIELKKAARRAVLCSHFRRLGIWAAPIVAGGAAAWDYATKTATRQLGPWKSTDSGEPKEIKGITLWPIQQEIVAAARLMWSHENSRWIHVFVDPNGCAGKSTLVKYLLFHHLAGIIHASDSKSMGREAYNQWEANKSIKAWIIDLPRKQTKLLMKGDFYVGIENIKNGSYADDRNKHRFTMESNPVVIILMNELPELAAMSTDRWRLRLVYDKKGYAFSRLRYETALAQWHAGQDAAAAEPTDDCPLDTPSPAAGV